MPDQWQNCFIVVDGKKLHWRTGQDIMFDDMFLHHVENNTDQPRVILFLDIKRDFKNVLLNLANTLFLKFVKSNDALNDTIDNANNNVISLRPDDKANNNVISLRSDDKANNNVLQK